VTLLTALWVLPLAAAVACFGAGRAARSFTILVSFTTLALSLVPLVRPVPGFVSAPWAFGARYAVAVDGLSLPLIVLTAFLTLIVAVASRADEFPAGYWSAFLVLESALIGVFLMRDLFFFYIFWEAALIPMFFIIGLWGSENRRHAAVKFFLFTFAGSIFMLLGFLMIVTRHHQATGIWTWDMEALRGTPMSAAMSLAVFASLIAGFGVKIPIVPLHTWLPDAHTEAPAGGSVMLAGVMLKMGVYGLLRVALPLFPQLSWDLLPWLGGIAAVNVIYGALCAMAQKDLKRLIAYSSVAHLGFCLLGVFSRTSEGLAGGTLQLVNHGLTTGALFLLVGFLYERAHKRGVSDFGALVERAPWMTFFFGFSVFASIGLPGLNGFVGEFMSLAGMTRALPVLAVAGVAGVTLAAVYALPAFAQVFWAPPAEGSVSDRVTDLDARERGVLWALCVPMLVLGLWPKPVLALIESSVRSLLL
jgi:NADH-quinone oxidoreductase subunit M